MPTKAWTPERRWASLAKAGAVEAGQSPDDLEYASQRLHRARFPTMFGPHIPAQTVRNLFDHTLDLMDRYITEARDATDAEWTLELVLDGLRNEPGGEIRSTAQLDPRTRAFIAKAALLLPTSVKMLIAEADVLLGETRHEEAERLVQRVLAIDPGNARAAVLARVARLDPDRGSGARRG